MWSRVGSQLPRAALSPEVMKEGRFLDNHSASLLAMPAAPKSRQSSYIASCNVVAVGVNAPAFWGSSHRSTYWHGRMTAGESLIKVVMGSRIERPFEHCKLVCVANAGLSSAGKVVYRHAPDIRRHSTAA